MGNVERATGCRSVLAVADLLLDAKINSSPPQNPPLHSFAPLLVIRFAEASADAAGERTGAFRERRIHRKAALSRNFGDPKNVTST
jgi:hypothetical protein